MLPLLLHTTSFFFFFFAMYPSSHHHFFRTGDLGDAVVFDLTTRNPVISPRASSNVTAVTSSHQFGGLAHATMASLVDGGRLSLPRGQHTDNWGDSGMAVTSPQTDTSTEVETDDRSRLLGGDRRRAIVSLDCSVESVEKTGEQKTLRRLVQNREAARKSRLRKKAYVQQLESSRVKLLQLEHELQRARQQGIFIASGCSGDHSYSVGGNGALAFDTDYARWLDENQRRISDLWSALNSHTSDDELHPLVDSVMSHYDEVFKLKSIGTKEDVFHMISGMWMTPAERCFMWLGGFRSSEILKLLAGHIEPMTDQQLMGICNLQQSSQQAEDALSQGMEALQQSLADTLAAAWLSTCNGSDNVANYMGQMAVAMGKLGALENFLRQADLLRQQTLQQLRRILTVRQAARALLAISDYLSRFRALSSLWLAQPRG